LTATVRQCPLPIPTRPNAATSLETHATLLPTIVRAAIPLRTAAAAVAPTIAATTARPRVQTAIKIAEPIKTAIKIAEPLATTTAAQIVPPTPSPAQRLRNLPRPRATVVLIIAETIAATIPRVPGATATVLRAPPATSAAPIALHGRVPNVRAAMIRTPSGLPIAIPTWILSMTTVPATISALLSLPKSKSPKRSTF
jgi:hypothetical protein